jgi:hypothetical protein
MEGTRMQAIRIRLTTRRLMILVAASAVLLFATIHGGHRPGAYFEAGGWSLGAWRDDRVAHGIDAEMRPTGRTYRAGLWRDRAAAPARSMGPAVGPRPARQSSPAGEPADQLAYGVEFGWGKVILAWGGDSQLIW